MGQAARADDKNLQLQIQSGNVTLPGELILPEDAHGVVLFAHGSAVVNTVPGASHLFEEPGTLERVVQLAAEWLQTYLNAGEVHGNSTKARA